MKLKLDALGCGCWEKNGYSLPKFDIGAMRAKTETSPEWLHFGAGNIFRAFPAALCQQLLENGQAETGIVVCEGFDGEIIDKAYQPFEIPDGQLVSLLGPSGCGKSTALNLICGLIKPTSGKIFFGDADVTDLPPENRGVGMVFQNYALYPHLTVLQNIIFPLQNLKGKDKLSKQEMIRRANEVAGFVQIDKLMNRKPRELSGGQQQRVAIARALVKTPRVLLLDEPLSNLDARLRLQTREEIRRIQRETKITTVFVTHDQDEAMSISDTIIVMREGVVQQIGKPQQVYDNPVNLFVAKFLGTPPINVFDGVIRAGKLMVGGDVVMNIKECEDCDVYVGVRPEGFTPDKNGALKCKFKSVEVMGRDVSVLFTHDGLQAPTARAIVGAEHAEGLGGDEVRFSLKPGKVFIFDRATEKRIEFRAE